MARRWRPHRYSQEPIRLSRGTWQAPFPVTKGVSPATFKCPLPQSDAEFAILSEIVFGQPLSLGKFFLWDSAGQMQIAEKYDSFAPKNDGHYTIIGMFLRTVAGPMNCSMSLTYTDFKRYDHRHWLRLERWQKSRRNNDSRTVRPAFVRLAHRFGVGENIIGRVDRRSGGVLSSGRVDAALAASILSQGQQP